MDIQKLLDVMSALRAPDTGCPWDLQQDFASIAPYTVEEAYEVADAIERQDWDDLQDELGDLLLQVAYHAQMASEQGLFEFADVTRSIVEKMIRRHPHVFGDENVTDAATQSGLWEQQKQQEREASATRGAGALAGVARSMPALMRAAKIGKRAARVGFDWPDIEGARAKVDEELAELDEARVRGSTPETADELGDALFALVNVARHLDIDPEQALRAATFKFERRFNALEADLLDSGATWAEESASSLDERWHRAKKATV